MQALGCWKRPSQAKISRLLSRGPAAPSPSRGLTRPTLPRTLPCGQPWAPLLKEPNHDSIPHLPHRPHCLPPAYSFPRNFFLFFLFLNWNFFVLILSCHFFFHSKNQKSIASMRVYPGFLNPSTIDVLCQIIPCCWRVLSCALQDIYQHPRPLLTRCQEYPHPPVIADNDVSRNFQGSSGGQKSPLVGKVPRVENHWFSLWLVKPS